VKRATRTQLGVFCLLVALGVFGRWIGPKSGWFDLPPNFTPMAAIGLLAGYVFVRRTTALLVPLVAMAISNLALESYDDWKVAAAVYASFLVAPLLGRSLREKTTVIKIVVAATLPAVLFYLTTNFAHWIVDSQHVHGMYSRDWNGLLDCYAAGIPFFRSMLEGDVLFGGVLFGLYALATVWSSPRRMMRQPVYEERRPRR
jgi:uncharacterized protein DUF6580